MNFKEHFEKLEADIRKRLDEDEEFRESLRLSIKKHDEIVEKINLLMKELEKSRKLLPDPFFTNEEFMELMSVSVRTAQLWRDQKFISYSQISGKLYYRLSDIQKLLDENFHKSINKPGK